MSDWVSVCTMQVKSRAWRDPLCREDRPHSCCGLLLENARLKRELATARAETYDKCKFVYNEVKRMHATANTEVMHQENRGLKRNIAAAHSRITNLEVDTRKLAEQVNNAHALRRKIRSVVKKFHPDRCDAETFTPTRVTSELTALLEQS